ncbi:MAG: GTP cyclohydrolase II, partial [Methylococcales bacterium]
YQMEDNGIDLSDFSPANFDSRTTGTGAQILSDLGVRKMRVLGERRKYLGISSYDLKIVEYVPCGPANSKFAVTE